MTFLSFFNSFIAFGFLASLILWKTSFLYALSLLLVFSLVYTVLETKQFELEHYLDSFWMFILSEILIFASLLVGCLWFSEDNQSSLSDFLEIPFLGCFLLIGSSLTVTFYHHSMLSDGVWSRFSLAYTILLGFGFILLQLVEFSECNVNLLYSVYHACCFCTVGLHFSHVLIGLILLSILFSLGCLFSGNYYTTLIIWYWHFVDYIWLFVYFVVYLC
uniref:cytochrome c oxidase subunit III n=1 Tax=Tetraonchus monenteron TaxID=198446 RepID=UPI001436AF6D|nr:cytochrome c oxidase subunit III [Tetraonchus monenteron]QIH29908.1 cytochrome c oxidase subunit 3 [Tetraonchus monenteron]